MSKHTAEPWEIDRDYRPGMSHNNHIVSSADPNQRICFMSNNPGDNSECEANARRIVACVNACAGISNDELEKFWSTSWAEKYKGFEWRLKEANAKNENLQRQNAELLEALEELVAAYKEQYVQYIDIPFKAAAIAIAQTAIAKAKGEA